MNHMAEKTNKSGNPKASPTPGGDAVYAFGVIGACVYYWQRADTSGGRAIAVLKGMVWPAFLVYEAFSALTGRPESALRKSTQA